jgi:hypothetical protein
MGSAQGPSIALQFPCTSACGGRLAEQRVGVWVQGTCGTGLAGRRHPLHRLCVGWCNISLISLTHYTLHHLPNSPACRYLPQLQLSRTLPLQTFCWCNVTLVSVTHHTFLTYPPTFPAGASMGPETFPHMLCLTHSSHSSHSHSLCRPAGASQGRRRACREPPHTSYRPGLRCGSAKSGCG